MKNVPKVAKKTNIYKQLFVSLFACKWVSMEQKLSHYRSHKYETNLHRGRQHDGVHFFLFILILRYVLLILFLLFQVCNVQLLLKMWDPVDCAVVNKLTIKYSTSSVGRSQWKIDTKASDVGEGNLAKPSQAKQHILYQCSGHSDPALTRSHRHTAKTASTNWLNWRWLFLVTKIKTFKSRTPSIQTSFREVSPDRT